MRQNAFTPTALRMVLTTAALRVISKTEPVGEVTFRCSKEECKAK